MSGCAWSLRSMITVLWSRTCRVALLWSGGGEGECLKGGGRARRCHGVLSLHASSPTKVGISAACLMSHVLFK